MELIFQDGFGEERVITKISSIEEAFSEINKFLSDHNFKHYYTRMWEENGRLKLDVGSYTEFFYIDDFSFEECKN